MKQMGPIGFPNGGQYEVWLAVAPSLLERQRQLQREDSEKWNEELVERLFKKVEPFLEEGVVLNMNYKFLRNLLSPEGFSTRGGASPILKRVMLKCLKCLEEQKQHGSSSSSHSGLAHPSETEMTLTPRATRAIRQSCREWLKTKMEDPDPSVSALAREYEASFESRASKTCCKLARRGYLSLERFARVTAEEWSGINLPRSLLPILVKNAKFGVYEIVDCIDWISMQIAREYIISLYLLRLRGMGANSCATSWGQIPSLPGRAGPGTHTHPEK